MHLLDDLHKIKNLDKSNLLGSVQEFALQLEQTKEDLAQLNIPKSYQTIKNIVVNGMGGSRLGGRVAQRLFEDTLRVPIYNIGYYELPRFVNEDSLLILSSYSGNTEETLATVEEALKRKAKILIYAQNGKLAQVAQKNNLPGYCNFSPKHNPSNQPRMSIGYQIMAILLMLVKCKLLTIQDNEIDNLIKFTLKVRAKYNVDIPLINNFAKQTAQYFQEKIPVFIGAQHLVGALHVIRNQLNENSKQFNVYFEIPEMNHHLLEGMQFPHSNPQNLRFFFVQSKLYHPRVQARFAITKKVLAGYKIKYEEINLQGQTKIEQVFEVIQFGSFVSFYLAILNNLDPTPIPWVDYFKKQLAKQ